MFRQHRPYVARRQKPHSHAGLSVRWAEPTTRLPCRRSWVRVPSSALLKAPEIGAFVLSGELPELLFTVRPPYSRISRCLEDVRLQRDRRLAARALVEVPIALEDERAAVRVSYLLCNHLDVAAGGDHQRRSGVAEIVERELGHASVGGRRLEHTREEVVTVEGRARGSGEEVAVGRGRAREL